MSSRVGGFDDLAKLGGVKKEIRDGIGWHRVLRRVNLALHLYLV